MKNKLYLTFKRAFDIVCSLIGIVLTSPIWIAAIVGIEISDPGPIFYVANRVGKDNRRFKMFKFRSMRCGKANEAVFRGDENRVFAFGKVMRATKIDELPQLLNILFGDMSFVGPRPAAPDQLEIVRAGKYARASRVRAGLTSPSALYDYIYGDKVTDAADYERLVLPTRLALDVAYVDKMNFFYDIKMIWYTVVCIICAVLDKTPNRILNELVNSVPKETMAEIEAGTVSDTADDREEASV